MKLLRVIRSINPEGGGPVEGLKQSSQILINLGHEIEILSLDSAQEDYINQFPLTVHTLGPGSGTYGYSKTFKPWLDKNYNKYDAIIVHGMWQYHGFAVRNTLKNKDVPYYVFTHGMLDPWFKKQYPLKHLKKWLYWPWAEYKVLRDARKVFFTTEEEKILARESFWLYKCNEHVLNYGTAGANGNPDEQRELFLSQFPSLKNKRFLLFLSRIHPKKGLDMLIQAFAETSKKSPDLELAIAGPDQVGWATDLKLLAEKLGIAHKITWTGMLEGNLKWGAYLSAEAFILPSHQENFGIVVAEALSCHLPVLISNKVNIWREIEQDNAGFVADDTLPDCIDLLNRWNQTNRNVRTEMQINARSCFENRFEIKSAASSLITALNH